jgi:hypothetical protein
MEPPALMAAAAIEVDALDCQHHVRFPEPARAHSPAERHATGWLPTGATDDEQDRQIEQGNPRK